VVAPQVFAQAQDLVKAREADCRRNHHSWPANGPGAPAAAQPSLTAHPAHRLVYGPASGPVTPPPVEPPLGAMPDATDPGRSDAHAAVRGFGQELREVAAPPHPVPLGGLEIQGLRSHPGDASGQRTGWR
jgi:hypothetical protein